MHSGRIAGIVVAVGLALTACSSPNGGDEAKAHAEKLGFTVTGVNERSVVVEIGEHCKGEFTSWSLGNGDQINRVFLNGKDIWNRSDTKAADPDQFRDYSQTAGCYDD